MIDDKYWKGVPEEYAKKWVKTYSDNKEGAHLSDSCPICNHKELHRYYQMGKPIDRIVDSNKYIATGAEWQWCGFCRHFEHMQSLVPDWWKCDLQIDGNKLTVIPAVLDLAYRDIKKVNKWNLVPNQFLEIWNDLFDNNSSEVHLAGDCPICGKKGLYQYYTVSIPGEKKYIKKIYKGQGAHWEWCNSCYHYRFDHLSYVPLNWEYMINIDPGKLMTIPELINDEIT